MEILFSLLICSSILVQYVLLLNSKFQSKINRKGVFNMLNESKLDKLKLDDDELNEIAGGISPEDIEKLSQIKKRFYAGYPQDIAHKKFIAHVATNYGLPMCKMDLTIDQTQSVLKKINLMS